MFVVHLHCHRKTKDGGQLFVNLSFFAIFNTYVSWTIPFYTQPARLRFLLCKLAAEFHVTCIAAERSYSHCHSSPLKINQLRGYRIVWPSQQYTQINSAIAIVYVRTPSDRVIVNGRIRK